MNGAQVLTHRDRDLNTSQQFIRALGISAVAHVAIILALVVYSLFTYKPRPIVPGHKVKLVNLPDPKPSSLLEPTAPKKEPEKKKPKPEPPKPKVKKPPVKKPPKKKPVVDKKKTKPKKEKIVPKKEEPKPVEKETQPVKTAKPEPEKAKPTVAPEKTTAKKEGPPRKTIVTDGVEFKYLWYLKRVEQMVRENWITHRLNNIVQQDDPIVYFKIGRNGNVFGVSLEQSSGSVALDRSVIEAVEKAQPFPALPDGYKGSSLGVHFGFDYDQVR